MSQVLNEKQKLILDFIIQNIETKGYPPSIREIAKEVGLSSSATVQAYLNKLEKLGYLKRSKGSSRSIKVLKTSYDSIYHNYDLKNLKRKDYLDNSLTNNDVVLVPVLGNVAAGTPIFAQENVEEYFPITSDFIKDSSHIFILKVKGDSMINAGILDRDYIIVKKQEVARSGEIIVALIDSEATVKRFLKTDKVIKLIPENDFMKPIIVKEVNIIGKVIGVIRKYFWPSYFAYLLFITLFIIFINYFLSINFLLILLFLTYMVILFFVNALFRDYF